MTDLFELPTRPSVPVLGEDGRFPVHRIFCVGRNYEAHAREMGFSVDRDAPFYFTKTPSAICPSGATIPYPPGTTDLQHEVELVVALGHDAPHGVLAAGDAGSLVYGYGIGLDLTRRDLQAAAKAKGLPWDTGKAFDQSAPVSELLPASEIGTLAACTLSLEVNGAIRQQSRLDQLIWDVPDILHELSKLYALRAGDLVFMGTPAGVAALRPHDACIGRLDDLLELRCRITPPRVA